MTDGEYEAGELAAMQKYADEAEQGYDVADLKRRGRPRLGPAARSVVLPIRVTPELIAVLDQRRAATSQTRSEAARDVLEATLIPA